MTRVVDVAIIGAGVAGLAAAARVREAGLTAQIVEAAGRIGGRAWTVRNAALGEAYFDAGAIWLHVAESNPLVPIARAAGEVLVDADAQRSRRLWVGGRLATAAELDDYAGAWDRYEAAADRLLAQDDADRPLADVARSIPDDPWAVTVETWEGPVICVADAAEFSLRDWRSNLLDGGNLLVQGGLGDFVARRLGPPADVALGTPAGRVGWQEPGGRVAVETPAGRIDAAACIVTVSTGVLAAEAIRFDPPLPATVQQSLHELPMGLALRVVLRAAGADRLDLPPFTSLSRRFERSGEPAIVFQAWPWGFDYVAAWIGGSLAWELSRAGAAAIEAFTRDELARLLGGRARDAFRPAAAFLGDWGADPLVRGAYSFTRPGNSGARLALGAPLAGGRLLFAGEAVHPTLAGTVGGAWLSGRAAADAALRQLPV